MKGDESLPMTEAQPRAPRIRLRLSMVLILVSLLILMLPLVGLYALRLHENTLLLQTQSRLETVAALLGASYRVAYERLSARPAAPGAAAAPPVPPRLEFDTAAVLGPFPAARTGAAAEPIARRAGAELVSLVRGAASPASSATRLLDRQGVVVASTAGDEGLSLAHADEVAEALTGAAASSLRRAPSRADGIQPLVRGVSVRMLLAIPVFVDGEVAGVVAVAKRPSNILDTLVSKRVLVAQGAAVFLAVALAVALVTARTLVLPIRRLTAGAVRVAQGETDRIERGRHRVREYRVRELAALADSLEAMVATLQRRSAYLRDFAHQLNHQYKTPVAAARGALELLRDDIGEMTPQEARRFADNALADIGRLDRLTARLLDLAQADMAQVTGETVDVRAVARDLADAMADDRLAVRVAAGPPLGARASRWTLQAILENLLDNARRHGARRVAIDAERDGDATVLCVQDDGQGVSPVNREKVFDPFFTTRQDSGGTGLGLAICRTLTRNLGGDIELADSARGARFKVTLRAAEVAPTDGALDNGAGP